MASLPKITFSSAQILANDACHGTSDENAQSILKDGFKVKSTARAWLGAGYYFFHGESAVTEAKRWAELSHRQGRLTAPLALLRCMIDLGRCIDYDDPACLRVIHRVATALADRKELNIGNIPPDAAVISLMSAFYQADSVRAQRIASPAFAGSHFVGNPATYLCVINRDKILDVTLSFTWTP